MAGTLNRWQLIARVGKKGVLLRDTAAGPVAHLSVATDRWRRPRPEDDFVRETDWHRSFAFNPQAERLAAALRPGDLVLLEGPVVYDTFQVDGVEHSSVRLLVRHFDRLGRPHPRAAQDAEGSPSGSKTESDFVEPSPENLAIALDSEPLAPDELADLDADDREPQAL
jgi:single-stranded DNA-binding protein